MVSFVIMNLLTIHPTMYSLLLLFFQTAFWIGPLEEAPQYTYYTFTSLQIYTKRKCIVTIDCKYCKA